MKQNNTCLPPKDIEQKLKKSGIMPTAQRIAISRFVLCEGNHPSADQVKKWADANCPKVSLATVYNTLKILVDAGLLKERKFTHLDNVVYDANLEHHYHFLNENSGDLEDIALSSTVIDHTLPEGCEVSQFELLIKGKKTENIENIENCAS